MSDPRDFPVYRLLFNIVCDLVDHSDKVVIKTVWTDDGATFAISVHPDDTGELIGKEGENANSIRTIVDGAGVKVGRKFIVAFDTNLGDSDGYLEPS
jgi:predicted RNA-binding protein YlqC (UPF0109 family)